MINLACRQPIQKQVKQVLCWALISGHLVKSMDSFLNGISKFIKQYVYKANQWDELQFIY